MLKVAITPGIGDSLWVLTKLQSILERSGEKYADLYVCNDGGLKRSEKFLLSFPFIKSVNYSKYSIVASPDVLPSGIFNYAAPGINWHNQYHWVLQANGHLEEGKRLEDWLPEYNINWNIMDQYNYGEENLDYADKFYCLYGDYCVLYFGPESGNSIGVSGHNRDQLWKPTEWVELVNSIIYELGINCIAVGASYDLSFYTNHLTKIRCANYIGQWEINRTLSVIKNAKFVLGYQSGIPITSCFMGKKAGAFWRPHGNSICVDKYVSFSEDMAHCWVPPQYKDNWLPLIYTKCSVESIVEWLKLQLV